MQVVLHGVRGSRPVHKPSHLGFGGNSTCVEFVIPDQPFFLFLDGGTGLAQHGMRIGEGPGKQNFHFLVTHTHWDHVLGYPFFSPLYNSENSFVFYASSPKEKESFESLFWGLFKKPQSHVHKENIKANIEFRTVAPHSSFSIEKKVEISTYQLNHQGITLGYRVKCGEYSAAVITDNAPIEKMNFMGEGWQQLAKNEPKVFENRFNTGLIRFLENCDLVIFDTHFTEENLKADWGHSTPFRAMDISIKAGVKRLVLFHHAPEDKDQDVQKKLESVERKASSQGMEIVAAVEGSRWVLG